MNNQFHLGKCVKHYPMTFERITSLKVHTYCDTYAVTISLNIMQNMIFYKNDVSCTIISLCPLHSVLTLND